MTIKIIAHITSVNHPTVSQALNKRPW